MIETSKNPKCPKVGFNIYLLKKNSFNCLDKSLNASSRCQQWAP